MRRLRFVIEIFFYICKNIFQYGQRCSKNDNDTTFFQYFDC